VKNHGISSAALSEKKQSNAASSTNKSIAVLVVGVFLVGVFLEFELLLLGPELLGLLDPEVGEVAILVALEPWPAARVVDGLGPRCRVGGVDLVVSDEEVPDEGQLPDLVVVEPREPVEERASLGADGVGGERGDVLGVGAVEEHHGGPVLARVHGLDGAVHLGGLGGPVVVLDAGDGEAGGLHGGHGREEVGDVGEVEEVAVDEERPAAVPREVRGEEAREGELGALGGPARPPVEPRRAEFRLQDGAHVERDGGAAEQAAAAHLVRLVLARVVPDEHAERLPRRRQQRRRRRHCHGAGWIWVEENGGNAAEIGNGEGDRMGAAAAKYGEEMKPWDGKERTVSIGPKNMASWVNDA
jgi:hypothetical protein